MSSPEIPEFPWRFHDQSQLQPGPWTTSAAKDGPEEVEIRSLECAEEAGEIERDDGAASIDLDSPEHAEPLISIVDGPSDSADSALWNTLSDSSCSSNESSPGPGTASFKRKHIEDNGCRELDSDAEHPKFKMAVTRSRNPAKTKRLNEEFPHVDSLLLHDCDLRTHHFRKKQRMGQPEPDATTNTRVDSFEKPQSIKPKMVDPPKRSTTLDFLGRVEVGICDLVEHEIAKITQYRKEKTLQQGFLIGVSLLASSFLMK
ncbi:MAG: hypothetical protein SGCHY_000817 [Lobulomycetales sp.]